jgi:hypothetical protein
MRSFILMAASVATVVLSMPALAAPIVYSATLKGSDEVPPNASTGTGEATFSLDGTLLTVSLTYSGVSAPLTGAHIHCCAGPGANAPVAIDFDVGGFVFGLTSGSHDAVYDLGALSTYRTGFVTANGGTLASAQTAFLNGLGSFRTYVNLHNAAFPGGEIRGQIPEPAALSLLGLGLLGLAARRRKPA